MLRYKKALHLISLVSISFLLLADIAIVKAGSGYDYDVWWHLKYGQHFFDNLTWSIDHSSFSWTSGTRPWTYVTWLGSSLLYITYLIFSYTGVFSLPPFVLACTLIVYILFLRSIGLRYSFITLALFFLLAPFLYLSLAKPAIFSILFFSICLSIYFASRNGSKNWYWWYPLLFFIWTNTHGGFIFGLFFLFLAYICELGVSLFKRSTDHHNKKYLLHFGAALLLSLLALSINPYGPGYLLGIVRDITASDSVNPSTYIAEYRHLWGTLNPMANVPSLIDMSWSIICFFMLFILFNLYLLRKRVPVDIIQFFLVSIFFIFAMHYLRMVIYFSIVLLFSVTSLYQRSKESLPNHKFRIIVVGFMLYFSIWGISNFLITSPIKPSLTYLPNLEVLFPVKASRFIIENKLPSPILNSYTFGGYMLWANYPEQKVFVDPRYWPYDKQIIDDIFSLDDADSISKVESIIDRYPKVQTLYLNLSLFKPISVLCSMNSWRLVYFDHLATIFVRTSNARSALRPDLNTDRFSMLNSPASLDHLFKLYMALNEREKALAIRKILDKNVRPDYLWKSSFLKIMDLQLQQVVK